MDLTKLSDDELKILDAVFCSFDQGDPSSDLEHIDRSPECEEEKDNIYEGYESMRDNIEKVARERRTG